MTKNKLTSEQTLGIILLIGVILVSIITYSIYPDHEYKDRIVYPVVKNTNLPAQYISSELQYAFDKNETISAPYTGECEKELFNRYAESNNSFACMDTFLLDINQSKTYGQLFDNRKSLLSCITRKDVIYRPLKINFMGIDIPLFELPTVGILCKENKTMLKDGVFPFMVILSIAGLLIILSVFRTLRAKFEQE